MCDTRLFLVRYFFAGKPPISRNPSSVTPKKRLPFHKKPAKGFDTLSVRSAPSSAQKSGSLSTTVVSHVTTSSANSAPLHDADPSHYRDFADDINSQVRQNKLVRSSAIHDGKRFWIQWVMLGLLIPGWRGWRSAMCACTFIWFDFPKYLHVILLLYIYQNRHIL